jgi:hypothetical protein
MGKGRVAAGAVIAALAVAGTAARQGGFNSHDDFTEYQLLDPASHQFHIVYYLNQRQAGATTLLNQTRSGSAGSDIAVSDPRTGSPLKFDYMTGAELSAAGQSGRLAAAEHYIRAFLPRPVPQGGEGRVRIEKTYLDEKSYFAQGGDIVFARSLGIGRNAILLPAGYVLASSNVAAQMTSVDGRVKLVFENVNTYASDVTVRGRRSAAPVSNTIPVSERAFDFAKTAYDLGDPAAHEVGVRHEYVEMQAGPRSSPPFFGRHRLTGVEAMDMDTGRSLTAAERAGALSIDLSEPVGGSIKSAHLRVTGRETDPAYRLEGGQLAWERTLYEPRTTILLPAGWEPVAISTPATVTTGRDARVAIQVYNPRIEPVGIAIRAVRAGR